MKADHVGWLAAAALLLGAALTLRPLTACNAGEYGLMAESLYGHLSPDLRPRDVQAAARHDRRLGAGLNYAAAFLGYFPDAKGTWYCYHFWGYPALVLPAKLAVQAVGLNGLRAFAMANAVLLLLALRAVLFARRPDRADADRLDLPDADRLDRPDADRLDRLDRLLLFALVLFSPALPFLRWPHPELATFALVVLALAALYAGRLRVAVLCAALGAMQNPPLVFFVAFLWLVG